MSKTSITYSNNSIQVIKKENLSSSFKIRSYKQKIEQMNKNNIPQKPINEVIEYLFSDQDDIISDKTKKTISKIVYNQDDRIIIIESTHGKEFIWNRDKLVNQYGWFFFITKSFGKKNKKEKNKGEITINEEQYIIDDFDINLAEKKNMRPLYKTKEYRKYWRIIQSNDIPQKSIKNVLNDFFQNNKKIPVKEKQAIRKIIYYKQEKVIVIKSLIGDQMYENLESLVRKYGWYFYITGVPVGKSEISIAIDKIEKRYDPKFFKGISLSANLEDSEKVRMTLYPIALRPNHNCLILGLGHLNILLDCGITEEFLGSIDEYLKNFNELVKKDVKSKIILSEGQDAHEDEEMDNEQKLSEMEKELYGNGEKDYILNKKNFVPKIDAVFLSHSHYDHVSGLKDFIKSHPDVPVITSRISLDLYLLRDSDFLKQDDHKEIEEEDYRRVVQNAIYVENGDKIEFKDNNCYLAFFHAGHMPGALMMLVKTKDFRFLYTGDYTYHDITPFAGTKRFLDQISRPIDFLLIDGCNAHEEFGNPAQHFHSLILFLEQKAEYGDNSLIGADPSSLAISFMLTFWRHFRKKQLRRDYKKRPNIYVDMMVRKNIQVINHRYEYIYGPISRLIRERANPFNSIKFRWFNHDDLDFLKKRNSIIISHPPDLSYGIIRNIINVIGRHPHNLVFLAGAIHEEPGESLIDSKSKNNGSENIIQFSDTWKVPFRALLVNTFSPQIKIKLHGDKLQLTEMIKNLEPSEVCFFHESPKKLLDVAEYVTTLGVEKVSTPQERRMMVLKD
ncbi:MAG: MBL fold metallo-hydrolase [Candidatus Lokiarchaeota archaeon]|nr:MBL fold metallo-hydrolase [Candidatus Lokiarchaeota archaeon]MBD3199304.1 MBL fold metallo-hydrolase [Candidatus Lokiarchaeota archaeon]